MLVDYKKKLSEAETPSVEWWEGSR